MCQAQKPVSPSTPRSPGLTLNSLLLPDAVLNQFAVLEFSGMNLVPVLCLQHVTLSGCLRKKQQCGPAERADHSVLQTRPNPPLALLMIFLASCQTIRNEPILHDALATNSTLGGSRRRNERHEGGVRICVPTRPLTATARETRPSATAAAAALPAPALMAPGLNGFLASLHCSRYLQ